MTLAELKAELAKIEAKISEIYETGESYNIVGSHSVKNPTLEALREQERIIRKRIFRFQGRTARTTPDFNTEDDDKDYEN